MGRRAAVELARTVLANTQQKVITDVERLSATLDETGDGAKSQHERLQVQMCLRDEGKARLILAEAALEERKKSEYPRDLEEYAWTEL